jgi:predicted TIM-barrel fold metal-dependent hydrolase
MEGYRPYIERKHLAAFDDYAAQVAAIDAKVQGANSHGGAVSRPDDHGLWDVSERNAYLDSDGISAEIIYTQGAVPFGVYPAIGPGEKLNYPASAEELAAGCRAYNRWLADLCSDNFDRHIGVARVPLPDVEAAVKEVEWARKAGLKGGVYLPPLSHESVPTYNDPMYEPFWAACEANEMTLNAHGGAARNYGPCPEARAINLAEGDWFVRRAVWFLIFSGVFERYPRLHLASTEQRAHWVEPLLAELDSICEWPGARRVWERISRRPSEYFRSNCFVGASFMSRLECEAREGHVEQLMWGSDYPHNEGTWPWTEISLRWTFGCGVPSDELRAMLGGNAARCYHLDLDALQPIADRIGPAEAALRVPVTELPKQSGDIPSWAFRRTGVWA